MDFNNQQFIAPIDSNPYAQPYNAMPLPPKKRRLGWLWLFFTLAIILTILTFSMVVYTEIAAREAQLRSFLESAQQETSGAIIENQLLGNLAGVGLAGSSSTEAAVATVKTVDAALDKNRRLAEKSGRPQLGNVSSSLVIVEFADFNCSVCLQEFPIIRAITNKYSKDIRFIFRNYPVIDQNSLMLAQAGLCAEEQGKFWSFHDRLYSSQGQVATLDDFKKVVVMSGLNWNKLQDCVNKEKYKPQVMEDMQDAIDLGAQGTPTFFINGKMIAGAIDEKSWDEIIAKYKELTNQK